MSDSEELIAFVVTSAGGEIVGRIRLQKVVYLLDQLGLGSGFSYSYHHYGPYSADLADAVDGAKAFRLVEEQTKHRRSDGMPFSIFSSTFSSPDLEIDLGDLKRDDLEQLLAVMGNYSATVLELAATIHWLRNEENIGDWRAELVRRKGVKTEDGRTDEAIKLLSQLGLYSEH